MSDTPAPTLPVPVPSGAPESGAPAAVLPGGTGDGSPGVPEVTVEVDAESGVPLVDISAVGPTDTPVQQIMELMREHGPVLRRRLHGRDVLFVSDPELVAELCDEERFAKQVGPALENVREFTADGLFTAYDDEPNWAKAHDILMPAFALGSMRTYHPVMLRVARRLIRSWDARMAAGQPVDVAEDMTRMTLDTIGLAGFGYDFGSFERPEGHPFVRAMVRCLEWSMNRLGRVPGIDYTEQDEAFRADADYLASVVDEVIANRAGSGGGTGTSAADGGNAGSGGTGADGRDAGSGGAAEAPAEDLLGLMLGAVHPADGTTLDHANIRNQVITFLIAGHETTSGALSFALHYLVRHPAELRAVQREVDALWGDTADPEPEFAEIGLLRRTRQALNEALRLWPTAAAFGRRARRDTLLGGRIPLRAGEWAIVAAPMLHRAPVWGDNPELFDPDRFAPEAEADRPVHAYKPFGTGERACIGRQFALHEATMLLALLVHRYRPLDHAGYRLRVKESLTLKPEGLTLTLRPRTAADRRALARTAPAAPAPGGPAGTGTDATTGTDAGHGPARVRPGTGLLVLHGSNYGTCRGFAAELAELGEALGCTTEVAPLDDYPDGVPDRGPAGEERPVVIVAASYNGRPTDDAARFTGWLERAEPGAAAGVPYAVLGVGDRTWAATYQRVPTLIDTRLAELGGVRLADRGVADAAGDLAAGVRAFAAALRARLLERYGDPESAGAPAAAAAPGAVTGTDAPATGPAYTVTELTGGPLDAAAARYGLVPMTVTASRDLTAPGYPRVKRLVRLALPAGAAYRTADHLTVLPANAPERVTRTAALLGADPDTLLSLAPARPGRGPLAVDRPLTVRELLTHHLDLGHRPGGDRLARLAALNPCPPERAALAALAAEAGDGPGPATLPELLTTYPALREALDWAELLELLPPMRPRTYSVSSSPAVDPGHLDLMVSVAPERPGTGSAHLAALNPGDTVLARLQPCRDAFRVEHGPRPLILIAAGTGLAPFRGVIADRRALLAANPAAGETAPANPAVPELAPANPAAPGPYGRLLCYVGCDAPDADYLHAEELRAAEAAGAVELRPAFSAAPVAGHRFVQHRIEAEAAELWPLLEAGAGVYVCGDGARMAPGVRAALRTVYLRHTPGAGEADAQRWLDGLAAEGRYTEDVYAG
ncbi:cytochrome P450 [Streptomyces sp. LP05-1]|uniref:NADPH--hemoprotein reductase n=1 Tax=Streptomyces pyxinae TaxID=2970734 RepID=A0ABT2CIR2_9ACTN|nr:cytochrome P450 [Streptomyces sp. LP05-1]MCS0637300.1 cytochrome P450 [Streptomyces sp. LP05-1]